jgi:hypothetical protein
LGQDGQSLNEHYSDPTRLVQGKQYLMNCIGSGSGEHFPMNSTVT